MEVLLGLFVPLAFVLLVAFIWNAYQVIRDFVHGLLGGSSSRSPDDNGDCG